jgi:hypothetical protein
MVTDEVPGSTIRSSIWVHSHSIEMQRRPAPRRAGQNLQCKPDSSLTGDDPKIKEEVKGEARRYRASGVFQAICAGAAAAITGGRISLIYS